jgi:hypothetical protein
MNVMSKHLMIARTTDTNTIPWRTRCARLLKHQGDELLPPGGRQDGQV